MAQVLPGARPTFLLFNSERLPAHACSTHVSHGDRSCSCTRWDGNANEFRVEHFERGFHPVEGDCSRTHEMITTNGYLGIGLSARRCKGCDDALRRGETRIHTEDGAVGF